MLSLHLSPKTARVSIAVCTLVAAAACNGEGVTAPPDFTLTPIVTFDDLKAALVEARNEQNGGDAADYGSRKDYMIGKRIGGTNVFGGGLPLYDAQGKLLGGLGVSGDASCADHNIAWKVRYNLHLDFVPAGVADPTTNNNHGDDNIIYDINPATGVSASGFGHPECSAAATAIGIHLPDPDQRPIGH